VIPTRPAIMPLMAPTIEGLPLNRVSIIVQTKSAVAVETLVLSKAAPAFALAKWESPPLKPFQPSHRMPAPANATRRLLGGQVSRSACSRGPITQAATEPDGPAAR